MCGCMHACVCVRVHAHVCVLMALQWGTADGEISLPTAENSQLSNVLPFKAEIGR